MRYKIEKTFKCWLLKMLYGMCVVLDGLVIILTFGCLCTSMGLWAATKLSIERHKDC